MLSADLETTVATAELVLVVTPSHAFGDVLRPSDEDFAHRVAQRLHSPSFRAYTGTDVVGAELGGAMKYVLAVATGTADGMKLGLNARAGLIARGLNEMLRLAAALGGKPETLMGLAGVGDLA